MLTNIHDPPSEGNFRDEHVNAIKPAIVADYNRHMGYVDKADRMANSYMASHRTWKWTKKLFFHLLDMTILNSYISLSTCGGKKISHREFRLTLVREMLARAGHEPRPSRAVGRTCPCICEHYQTRYTTQQALAGSKPDQEAMSRVFRARCNENGEVQV